MAAAYGRTWAAPGCVLTDAWARIYQRRLGSSQRVRSASVAPDDPLPRWWVHCAARGVTIRYTCPRNRANGRQCAAVHKAGPLYAVGLYRVSTAEQGQSGLGLEAQQASVRAFVAAQSWTLVAEHSDIASGKDVRRPGFQAALARCR